MRASPPPAPCTTYRPSAIGALEVVAIETREPLPVRLDWQPETRTYFYRVMCLQETGESLFVGHAGNRVGANRLIALHSGQHPEHYGYTVEPL